MADMTPHRCDDACVCPVDGKPLLYSATLDQHACQDPECRNAHGMPDIVQQYMERRFTASLSAPGSARSR